jgi:2-hydroxychromene-2-carboxylate isomerase
MLLGGVFKATGNASPAAIPAKSRWMNTDLARHAAKYGVPFTHNPHFPINTLHLMRGATGLIEDPRFGAYVEAVFEAMWREPRNLGDPTELGQVLTRAGVSADEFRALVERDDVKERLKATTEAAVARGAFGAPTFFVGEEMFFGQDRLDWVEDALSEAVPA